MRSTVRAGSSRSARAFSSATADVNCGNDRVIEQNRRHPRGEPLIISVADADAGDIGEEIAAAWGHGGAMEVAAAETILPLTSIAMRNRGETRCAMPEPMITSDHVIVAPKARALRAA